MRSLVVAAALLVSGCVFSSERPLFSAREAAFPFPDGALVEALENGKDEPERFTFRRTRSGYDVSMQGKEEDMSNILFVPVRGTSEEDYILQAPIEGREGAAVYGFMWRSGQGYRLILGPDEFDGDANARAWLASHCTMRSFGECELDEAAELRQFARQHARAFARNVRTPEDFMTLTVVGDWTRAQEGD